MPSIDLLVKNDAKKNIDDLSGNRPDSEFMEKVLMDFGIEGKIKKINNGPVVSLYEFEPAPGIKVSDTEVESIISDLRRLAQQFKSKDEEIKVDEELELAESVADAADRVNSLRTKIDGVDELLARLNLSNN